MTTHVLHYGPATRTCESRVSADGERFELVVTRDGVSRVESFASLDAMLIRERQVIGSWQAHGWRPHASESS